MSTPHQQDQAVALVLDFPRDAFAAYLPPLESAGIRYRLCGSVEDFCLQLIEPDVFCAVVSEPALVDGGANLVKQVTHLQAPGFDVPLFVLGAGEDKQLAGTLPEALYLTSPLSEVTFVSIVRLADRYHARRQGHDRSANRPNPAPCISPIDESKTVSASGRPIQVMLVDDHEIVLKGLRGVMAFYKDIEVVGEARSGIEALAKAEELQPQVIIMDVNMPMGNGIEVTRAIKNAFPGITIIGLSVYNDTAIIDSMREAGADAFFEKGIDENVIHAAIQAHTQRTAMEN